MTDRRSADKDRENERESGDFVTGVFVCSRVGVGLNISRYLPYRLKALPNPPSSPLFITFELMDELSR